MTHPNEVSADKTRIIKTAGLEPIPEDSFLRTWLSRANTSILVIDEAAVALITKAGIANHIRVLDKAIPLTSKKAKAEPKATVTLMVRGEANIRFVVQNHLKHRRALTSEQ